jgi:hypothetical protein
MFKTMNFSNFNRSQVFNQAYGANLARSVPAPRPRPITLNSPMVGRVHAAKPGCSACGKKVA